MKKNQKNIRPYGKNEFCRAVVCPWLDHINLTCTNKDGCWYTAKDFHHWLKTNKFKIVKDD